jgi:hypothetical protein
VIQAERAALRACACDDNRMEGGCCRQDRRRAGAPESAELLELLRQCFVRTEPWLQADKYAAAVMSDLRRRNGWTIAERSGDRTRRTGRSGCSTGQSGTPSWRWGWCAGSPWPGWTRLPEGPAGAGLAVGAVDETGQVTLVPPANTTDPPRRDRPGQVANGCCTTTTPRTGGWQDTPDKFRVRGPMM